MLNPGTNCDQESRLRLINPGDEDAEVTISGTGDNGASLGGEVRLTLSDGRHGPVKYAPAPASTQTDSHKVKRPCPRSTPTE